MGVVTYDAGVSSGYQEFLASKSRTSSRAGRDVAASAVHPSLHPWQARIVVWAVRKGRAAVWADTGLGKTVISLEWLRLSGRTGLVVAPLAVCAQTVREAERIGITARYVRDEAQVVSPGVWVTNYEMIERFTPELFDAVVLDEASILKQSDGKTRTRLIRHFAPVPRRLACTATPAPNDPEELTNQAEFLGVMPRVEMLAAYFVHDAAGWRLKGHAREPMFAWMSGWAVALRRPSDLGFDDGAYVLPPLNIFAEIVDVEVETEGQLFATSLGGVGGRARTRRATMEARCALAIEVVRDEPDESWLLWCGLNAEADALAKALPDAVNVAGSWSPEEKAAAFLDFADGKIRYLITKPSIAAFGLNWQHCARMAFVGISDSFESYYQAIRRCYRYGQTRPVNVHIVVSALERQIVANVKRKEIEVAAMVANLVSSMRSADTVREEGMS